MNGNDGSGCAGAILAGVLLVVVILAAVAVTGLPNVTDGALSWDTSATADRQQTERLRIQEEQQTERLRIEQAADTQRLWALVLGAVATIAVVGVIVVLITREAAKRPVVVVERPMLTYDERRRLDDVHVVDNPQRRMLR